MDEDHLTAFVWELQRETSGAPYTEPCPAKQALAFVVEDLLAKGKLAKVTKIVAVFDAATGRRGADGDRYKEQWDMAGQFAAEVQRVECPDCGQPSGSRCRTPGGKPFTGSDPNYFHRSWHVSRMRLARSLNDGTDPIEVR